MYYIYLDRRGAVEFTSMCEDVSSRGPVLYGYDSKLCVSYQRPLLTSEPVLQDDACQLPALANTRTCRVYRISGDTRNQYLDDGLQGQSSPHPGLTCLTCVITQCPRALSTSKLCVVQVGRKS